VSRDFLYFKHVQVTGKTTISAPLTNWTACSGDKALDGRKTYTGSDSDLCLTCSISAAGPDQLHWWQLDLQRKYLIGTIIVTGRMGISEILCVKHVR